MSLHQETVGTRVITRESFLSLYLPAMILALGTGIQLPALPLYAKMFEVSLGVAALVVVASGVGSLAAGLPTGLLLDRVGRRKVILAAPICAVTNTITTGNMQTLGSDIAPAHARGSFFGISQTVVQVGHVISPTSFAILADNVSATASFLFLGVAALSVAVVVATVVADPTR